ncbi:MBL fold metallo-hydrolase [Phaeovibrio sulfidiphilus]|uniref:MBL fold metallo-hydrolase n=1 Tax=Phaeovibrio sulfidiphilus TaxID=1220600 RepID=A0A8J6YQ62_9PROT|nr:MBL fold metallo-hydrolase [Phaeovibrio sulfidiphilus]MBE1237676.1 MBL fold metallo-hydrolase [Phaeovibrio sulfidiphilus]
MTHVPSTPDYGVLSEVAPGIFWLRLPLPFALNHINVWVLRNGDTWSLVDTGVWDEATLALWEALLDGPLAGLPLDRLVCTHYHPDHMGLAGWLSRRFGVPVTTPFGEWDMGTRSWGEERHDDYYAGLRGHYLRCGCPQDMADGAERGKSAYSPLVHPLSGSWSPIADGDTLALGGRLWTVMTFSGHTPEHACLWCKEDGVLISGDQILPRISPTVGAWYRNADDDPLDDFLASLSRLGELPADTLVLPSHDRPFSTLRARCRELEAHHGARLQDALALCQSPASVFQVSQGLFNRRLDGHQQAFAIAETLAHLNHLVARGQMARTVGESGEWLFQATGKAAA